MSASRTILIAGGGIAGLSAALCLSRQGYRVEVYERSPKLEHVGAGIQLSANALNILDDLGLGKAIRTTAVAPDFIQIYNTRRAKPTVAIPLGTVAIKRFGLPYLSTHRGDLQSVLYNACLANADIEIRLAHEITDITCHANGASVLIKNKGNIITENGLMLIAADGIHSPIRSQLFEQSAAINTGLVALRTIIDAEILPSFIDRYNTTLLMGSGHHAVLYPIRSGRSFNMVLVTKAPKKHGSIETMLERTIGKWNNRYRGFINLPLDWTIWPIYDLPKLRNWSSDRVVLIGDAAHGMPPFAAQGAAMALEDAALLAKFIGNDGTQARTIADFVKERKPRVAKIRRLTMNNREIYHLSAPLSLARDFVMKRTSPAQLLERQAWIYDWKP